MKTPSAAPSKPSQVDTLNLRLASQILNSPQCFGGTGSFPFIWAKMLLARAQNNQRLERFEVSK